MSDLTFTAGQLLTTNHILAALQTGWFSAQSGAGTTTTSSSFANLGSSLSITKVFTTTQLRLDFICSYTVAGGTAPCSIQWGMNVNSTDYGCGFRQEDVVAEHRFVSSVCLIATGLAAGTYSCQPRWERVSGTGTPTWDTNCFMNFHIMEVQ